VTALDTFHSIIKQEGVAGLYRGLAPRLLKVAPACAVMIGCYDVGKMALE
jgi:solute carrier family 25 protein 39/40